MTTPYWKLLHDYGVKAGERIADLERDLENAKLPRGRYVAGKVTHVVEPTMSYILRKQAEAVDEALKSVTHYQMDNMDDAIEAGDIKDYADSLRQQADELERNQ